MINGILKDELGFQGFVMTDWLGHYAGVASAIAGLDMSMPGDGAVPLFGDSYWGPELSRSVLNGSVPVDRLNDMVRGPLCENPWLYMEKSSVRFMRFAPFAYIPKGYLKRPPEKA